MTRGEGEGLERWQCGCRETARQVLAASMPLSQEAGSGQGLEASKLHEAAVTAARRKQGSKGRGARGAHRPSCSPEDPLDAGLGITQFSTLCLPPRLYILRAAKTVPHLGPLASALCRVVLWQSRQF